MELAYQGERTTSSQCGRLDLACAYGCQPVLMTFDGDCFETQPLVVGKNLHSIVVDLGSIKDTQQILATLNESYPQAQNSIQAKVQQYLGSINLDLVRQAVCAISNEEMQRKLVL